MKPQSRRTEVEMGAQQPGVEPVGVRTMAPLDGGGARRSKRGGDPDDRGEAIATMDQGGAKGVWRQGEANGLEPKAEVESGARIPDVDLGGRHTRVELDT